jgi:uracil-DNA glycosylase
MVTSISEKFSTNEVNVSINPRLEEGWKQALESEFQQDYFRKLKQFLLEEYKKYTIYPGKQHIFQAFNLTPFTSTRVVILGQDPYHGAGQAHGLCFSVPEQMGLPPSLKNIYKELENDLGITPATKGDLSSWARQGVLLLNATLTVRHQSPGSHQQKGWETFTDAAIQALNKKEEPIIFLLWGRFARQKAALIDQSRHHILTAPHPSPFSAHTGFFGCGHFSRTNQLLIRAGKPPINWEIK